MAFFLFGIIHHLSDSPKPTHNDWKVGNGQIHIAVMLCFYSNIEYSKNILYIEKKIVARWRKKHIQFSCCASFIRFGITKMKESNNKNRWLKRAKSFQSKCSFYWVHRLLCQSILCAVLYYWTYFILSLMRFHPAAGRRNEITCDGHINIHTFMYRK